LGEPASRTTAACRRGTVAVADSGMAGKGWWGEVIGADHQNKPDIAAAIARKWFDVEGVDAVLDLTNTAAAPGASLTGNVVRSDDVRTPGLSVSAGHWPA
jgi:hypothetical protein